MSYEQLRELEKAIYKNVFSLFPEYCFIEVKCFENGNSIICYSDIPFESLRKLDKLVNIESIGNYNDGEIYPPEIHFSFRPDVIIEGVNI